METQIKNEVQILPLEVNELAQKISNQKKEEVSLVLNQIFTGTAEWENQVDLIEVKGIDDLMSMQLADTARLNAKKARLNAEKIFDAKREEVQTIKAEFDLEDKLWLKAKQVMQLKFKSIEEKAEWKANFKKRFEAEQKELKTQKRINLVQPFAEINRIEFESMSDESFDSFLSGLKATHDAKIEAERKAEEERIAKEKAEKERIEAQRLENERLKAEAEKREKEIQEERAKAKAEADRIDAENRAKLKAEQDAKLKIEAELKAKKEAELKAENERKEAELRAKKEAEKLAKAPVKEKMKVWVNSFELKHIDIENESVLEIKAKFDSFKKWSLTQIENL